MEFDEFVRQFRERTAQRMVDFEAALAKAEAEMVKKTGKSAGVSRGQQLRGTTPPVLPARKTPGGHRRNSGPVQGVLKKS
ncbi:hypothetical protein [Corynebacterium sp. A21]|uniref:hypothetical protein n=1 Tax=Corynebacterium sp. A21 TaxID=3457318 RepID=UPI003FCF3E68